MPYVRPERASSICLVRTMYRGSGLTLNGFSLSPKKPLYMGLELSLNASYSILLMALSKANTYSSCTMRVPIGEQKDTCAIGTSGLHGVPGSLRRPRPTWHLESGAAV